MCEFGSARPTLFAATRADRHLPVVLLSVATGTVSAGTAAAYISGEVTLPFQSYVLGIIILAGSFRLSSLPLPLPFSPHDLTFRHSPFRSLRRTSARWSEGLDSSHPLDLLASRSSESSPSFDAGVSTTDSSPTSFISSQLATMSILIICSFIAWGRNGSAILVANWASSLAQWDGGRGAPRAVFNGICVGFLGVTGTSSLFRKFTTSWV